MSVRMVVPMAMKKLRIDVVSMQLMKKSGSKSMIGGRKLPIQSKGQDIPKGGCRASHVLSKSAHHTIGTRTEPDDASGSYSSVQHKGMVLREGTSEP